MNIKRITVSLSSVLIVVLVLGGLRAWAGPGIIQLATRSGFWANDFPDGPIFLQHVYYYTFDQVWDRDGDEVDTPDAHVTATFSRLIGVTHFGDHKQFQYVIEGIVPFYNFSMEESSHGAHDNFSKSGIGHLLFYNSLGWNNPSKTTHLTAYLAAQLPVGDRDVMKVMGSNSWALLPGVSFQQRFGTFWVEGSMAYWFNCEDLDSDAKGNDYFEFNIIATKHFTAPLPWWLYIQTDYTRYQQSDDVDGHGNHDDGYNWALAPGIGVAVRPNITIDVKYALDLDGKSTTKGQGVNLRILWKF